MDHPLTITDQTVTRLRALQAPLADGPLRDLLGTLASAPDQFTRKNDVLAAFRKTLKACKGLAPAEKEALVTGLEAVLDVLHIESSDGLLNEWLHGISL